MTSQAEIDGCPCSAADDGRTAGLKKWRGEEEMGMHVEARLDKTAVMYEM
jgi:hypothetical protein